MSRDFKSMRLGRAPVRHDHRTLQMTRYATGRLPVPPKAVDYSGRVSSWGMMANDTLGDCTCAALGHLIMLWTASAGKLQTPSDADVIKAYSDVTGYDPSTGANDDGAVELDVLNYARKVGLAGHRIEAYVNVRASVTSHVRSAIQLFEGCYIGLALPESAQTQQVWDVPSGGARGKGAPGSWGGHAVPIVGYDSTHLTCITWGQPLQMTWKFFAHYCEEAYALLSTDMIAAGKCPAGFDLAALRHDLAVL